MSHRHHLILVQSIASRNNCSVTEKHLFKPCAPIRSLGRLPERMALAIGRRCVTNMSVVTDLWLTNLSAYTQASWPNNFLRTVRPVAMHNFSPRRAPIAVHAKAGLKTENRRPRSTEDKSVFFPIGMQNIRLFVVDYSCM
jgi:hypothetical protein